MTMTLKIQNKVMLFFRSKATMLLNPLLWKGIKKHYLNVI